MLEEKNPAVETICIAFRSWQRLSDQVGFEPTATARKLVGVMGFEPISPLIKSQVQ